MASSCSGAAAGGGLPAANGLSRSSRRSRVALLGAPGGGRVAILSDPPALVIDDPSILLPAPPQDLVRVRSGPLAGAEGTWAGLAGPRRFPAGVTLEAAFVRFGRRPPVAIPIGDLERFA